MNVPPAADCSLPSAIGAAAERIAGLLRACTDPAAPIPGADWIVGEAAAHLAQANRLMADLAAGRERPYGDGTPGGLAAANAEALAGFAERDPAVLAEAITASAEEFRTAAAPSPGGRAGAHTDGPDGPGDPRLLPADPHARPRLRHRRGAAPAAHGGRGQRGPDAAVPDDGDAAGGQRARRRGRPQRVLPGAAAGRGRRVRRDVHRGRGGRERRAAAAARLHDRGRAGDVSAARAGRCGSVARCGGGGLLLGGASLGLRSASPPSSRPRRPEPLFDGSPSAQGRPIRGAGNCATSHGDGCTSSPTGRACLRRLRTTGRWWVGGAVPRVSGKRRPGGVVAVVSGAPARWWVGGAVARAPGEAPSGAEGPSGDAAGGHVAPPECSAGHAGRGKRPGGDP